LLASIALEGIIFMPGYVKVYFGFVLVHCLFPKVIQKYFLVPSLREASSSKDDDEMLVMIIDTH